MYCDQTDCGSLPHSVGEAIAKPRLSMALLGQTEERDSRVRLLVHRLGEFNGLKHNEIIFKQDGV